MLWPLVGRHSELASLIQALDAPLPGGILLRGPPGVGKSRLLHEFTLEAKKRGWNAKWIAAGLTSPSIPMGALAALFPDVGESPIGVIEFQQRIRHSLAERYANERLLLAVDDVHTLDPVSAAFLAQLTALGYGLFAGTVRIEERPPGQIEGLVKDQVISALDVDRLDDIEIGFLIDASLEGPIDPVTRSHLTRLAEGNPLYLREIIDHCRASGALSSEEGEWSLSGSPIISPTLQRLIEEGVGRLPPSLTAALEVLVLSQPLELRLFEEFAPVDEIGELERRGIVHVSKSGRRDLAGFRHPIFAETVHSNIPSVERRRVSGRLLHTLDATGARRRADPLRLGVWHLASGEPTDADRLSAAARLANSTGDHHLAERLANEAVRAGAGHRAEIALAAALSRQGRIEEAEQLLSQLDSATPHSDSSVLATSLRAENLGLPGGDLRRGLDVLQEALSTCAHPSHRAVLGCQQALLLAYAADMEAALDVCRRILEAEEAPRSAVADALTTKILLSIWRCDFDAVLDGCDAADQLFIGGGEFPADLRDRVGVARAVALLYGGRLEQAVSSLERSYTASVTPPISDYAAVWASWFAIATHLTGAVRSAVDIGRHSVALVDRIDPTGVGAFIFALQASHCGAIQDRAGVDEMVERLKLSGPAPPPHEMWSLWAGAWKLMLERGPEGAIALGCDAADMALETGILAEAAMVLSDVITWGPSERASTALARIAGVTTAPTIRGYSSHASALARDDAAALDDVAAGYVRRGENLHAVHALLQSAALHRARRRDKAAARAATRARQIAVSSTQLPTTVFAQTPEHLTRRETEIARLAARGLSSREIAQRLCISVRTVDNHLGHVYTKLGIEDRTGLPSLFAAGEP